MTIYEKLLDRMLIIARCLDRIEAHLEFAQRGQESSDTAIVKIKEILDEAKVQI